MPRTNKAATDAAQRVAAVMALSQDDTDTTELAPADNGPTEFTPAGDGPIEPVAALVRSLSHRGADATIAANITQLARHAELEYFADVYNYQVKAVGTLIGLVARADRQLIDRELLDPDLVRKMHSQVEGLIVQIQVKDEGAGS